MFEYQWFIFENIYKYNRLYILYCLEVTFNIFIDPIINGHMAHEHG